MPFGSVCVPKLVSVTAGNNGDLVMGMRIELMDGGRPVELLEKVLTSLRSVTRRCDGGSMGVLHLLWGGVRMVGELLVALAQVIGALFCFFRPPVGASVQSLHVTHVGTCS
ncbi:MAG: hypothetical protein QOD58_2136 [Mycobacterium sp.]|nr:hypothetical protein [Mycobacterium sp.]